MTIRDGLLSVVSLSAQKCCNQVEHWVSPVYEHCSRMNVSHKLERRSTIILNIVQYFIRMIKWADGKKNAKT